MDPHHLIPGSSSGPKGASSSSPGTASGSSSAASPSATCPKPYRSTKAGFSASGSVSLNMSMSLSCSTYKRPLKKEKKGVRIAEENNNVLEISSRSFRVARGDLALFYHDDEMRETLYCCICSREPDSDAEEGQFKIYNLPDGSWQLSCPTCQPSDPSWVFDRTVAVDDDLLPPGLLQLVFLFLDNFERANCALVCHQWNELAWVLLTLYDNKSFMNIVSQPKFRNVCILRVFLRNSKTVEAYLKGLAEYLPHVYNLTELQVTGLAGDPHIGRLAEMMKMHVQLQVVDVGACDFHQQGLRSLISALGHVQSGELELFLPVACVGSGKAFPTLQSAYDAVDRLLKGTGIKPILV